MPQLKEVALYRAQLEITHKCHLNNDARLAFDCFVISPVKGNRFIKNNSLWTTTFS